MSQLENMICRRRALAAAMSLGTSSLVPSLSCAVGDEEQRQRTPYSAPEYRHDQEIAYFRQMPVCRATRYASGVPATCTSKLLIDERGSIIINTLQFLDGSGWMNRSREMARAKMPTIKNAVYSDPDIAPTASSGVLIPVSVGDRTEEVLVSNEHALRAARWQLENKAVYDWHYDLAVIPAKHLLRNTDDRTQVTMGQLADTSVTNSTIFSKTVEVVGFGSDLFKFVGTPCRLPHYIGEAEPFAQSHMQQHLLFVLRIPDTFVRDVAEIGGMSGSPVVLAGTRQVVGIVSRVGLVTQGDESVPYLVFTGPNELRRIVERAGAAFVR